MTRPINPYEGKLVLGHGALSLDVGAKRAPGGVGGSKKLNIRFRITSGPIVLEKDAFLF